MKRRRLPADPRLKRCYNLCHRLRLKGVAITTDANAIEVTEQQYAALGKTARRYCDTLVNDYHYVIQFRIADEGSTVVMRNPASAENPDKISAVRHRRRRPAPTPPNR